MKENDQIEFAKQKSMLPKGGSLTEPVGIPSSYGNYKRLQQY